jgi:hypothetical protein
MFLVALLMFGGASRGEYNATIEAADFLYVPAWVPHQEMNPSSEILFQCTSEPIVDLWVNSTYSRSTNLRVNS